MGAWLKDAERGGVAVWLQGGCVVCTPCACMGHMSEFWSSCPCLGGLQACVPPG